LAAGRRYGTRLTPKQVDEIVGTTVSDRERWFKRWFGFTVFLYVVVVIVVLVATIYLPIRFARGMIVSP
jgi:hypothetical protein